VFASREAGIEVEMTRLRVAQTGSAYQRNGAYDVE
jgi:hypothetical protein